MDQRIKVPWNTKRRSRKVYKNLNDAWIYGTSIKNVDRGDEHHDGNRSLSLHFSLPNICNEPYALVNRAM